MLYNKGNKPLTGHSKTIPSPLNNFLITFNGFKIWFEYEVLVSYNKLGMIELTNSRTRRLELMFLLQEKYQMNSVEISDFLNSNNIKISFFYFIISNYLLYTTSCTNNVIIK